MSSQQISLLSFANQNVLNIKSNQLQLTLNNAENKTNANTHLEYLLAGLAASVNMVGHQVANELDMDLKSIQIEIKGTIDISNKNKSGFKGIELILKPVTNADLTTLKFWMDEIKELCPIYDNFLNATS